MKTKLLNILAALALTAAALATPSAFAWGAYAIFTERGDLFSGFITQNDSLSETDASETIQAACDREGETCEIVTFQNQCAAIAADLYTDSGRTTLSFVVIEVADTAGTALNAAIASCQQMVDSQSLPSRTCTVLMEGDMVNEQTQPFDDIHCDGTAPTDDIGTGDTDPVGGDMTEPPEFTFSIGGDALEATTTDDRYTISISAVSGFEINTATTLDGVTYAIDVNQTSSSALQVDMDGIVSFVDPDSVAADNYQIFIAATHNSAIVNTVSLYLTVAEDAMVSMTQPSPSVTTTTSSGSSSSNVGLIIGGVVVVGLAVWYFTSDSSGDLEWTPSYAFRNNNGDLSYSVGSRWTATTADNWNLYWQTRQNGDQFVYGSGFGYNGDILSAAMNSESEGNQTDIDLNLSANKTVGLWDFGGGYNFDMQLSDDATETQNRLNAKVRYTMDKWILSATATTDTARINYSYRF